MTFAGQPAFVLYRNYAGKPGNDKGKKSLCVPQKMKKYIYEICVHRGIDISELDVLCTGKNKIRKL